MKILLIEDDTEAAKYLLKGLREQGHVVDHAEQGKDGLFMATTEKYDAMIIDRMIPEVDGLTIVQTLRASSSGKSSCATSPRPTGSSAIAS